MLIEGQGVSFQRPRTRDKGTEDLIGLYAGEENGRPVVTHLATCCEGSFTPDRIREERYVVPEEGDVYSLNGVKPDHWRETWDLRKSEKKISVEAALITLGMVGPPMAVIFYWRNNETQIAAHILPLMRIEFIAFLALLVVVSVRSRIAERRRADDIH